MSGKVADHVGGNIVAPFYKLYSPITGLARTKSEPLFQVGEERGLTLREKALKAL